MVKQKLMTFPDFRACTYNARWSRFIIILYCYILVCDYLFLLDIIQLFAFSHFKEKKYPVPLTTVLWPKFRSYNIIPPVVFRLVRNFFFYYFFFLFTQSFLLSLWPVCRTRAGHIQLLFVFITDEHCKSGKKSK